MAPEPPSNGGYLIAAYVVAAIILLAYWLRLLRLARNARLSNRGPTVLGGLGPSE